MSSIFRRRVVPTPDHAWWHAMQQQFNSHRYTEVNCYRKGLSASVCDTVTCLM